MPKRTPGRILATLSIVSLAFAFVACVTPASESERSESSQNEAVLSQEEVDEKYREPGEYKERRRPEFQNPGYGTAVGSP
jgi:hypothetical protein